MQKPAIDNRMNDMERAILTGPTGAIGMALIEKLLKEGTEVLAIVHRGSHRINRIPKHPGLQLLEADLDELADLKLPEQDWDIFYHFAWSGTFGDARNNLEAQIDNIRYTLDAVRLAWRSGCTTFIGAGSQAEYGRYEGVLQADTPANPENGYGMAKLCAGQMSRQLCAQLGLRHIWTRILSVYGPYDGENTMISSAIKNMLDGLPTHFTKGEQLWDYLYSKDAADIFYLLGFKGQADKTYVLGSGMARPLRDYIGILAGELGIKGNLGIGDIPYGDKQVMHLQADTEPIKQDLGYASYTEFDKGIRETIESVRHELEKRRTR